MLKIADLGISQVLDHVFTRVLVGDGRCNALRRRHWRCRCCPYCTDPSEPQLLLRLALLLRPPLPSHACAAALAALQMGTPQYVAPEAWRGQPYSYSAGEWKEVGWLVAASRWRIWLGFCRQLAGAGQAAAQLPVAGCRNTLTLALPLNMPADVWALGCILHELCTRRPLFLPRGRPSDAEIRARVLEGRVQPISRK